MSINRLYSGAEILIEALLEEGVDTVFGYPGGNVLAIYDVLETKRRKIKHILTANEQGAAHAADGYARVSGKTGVVLATSGPGASNLVTGIATAYLDSVPMVAITGNVPMSQIGRDSFQELDIADITMPITKHNFIVKDVNELYSTIKTAFRIAKEGRCGPVLVDIPKNIQLERTHLFREDNTILEKTDLPTDEDLSAVIEAISKAERPFVYCGGGVTSSNAGKTVENFAEILDAPIGASLMGLSSINAKNDRMLGLCGIHGLKSTMDIMQKSDLIIAIGTRFSDRATGEDKKLIGNANIIQIDIDHAEIDKNIKTKLNLVGDAKGVLEKLISLFQKKNNAKWMNEVRKIRQHELDKLKDNSVFVLMQNISEICEGMTVITDVGVHQMLTAVYYPIKKQRGLITSGGLGTMGFGVGAGIGACIASGREKTLLFTGDGSFGMNLNELATAVENKLPLIIVIFNNKSLGMVSDWQKKLYGRNSQSRLERKTDFVMLARAFGAKGERASNSVELIDIIKKAKSSKDNLPFVIDFRIDEEIDYPINI